MTSRLKAIGIAAVCSGLVAMAFPMSQAAAQTQTNWTFREAYFTAEDGTRLHADVYLPIGADDERFPVILTITPYSTFYYGLYGGPYPGSPHAVAIPWLTDAALENGYAYVQVDIRSFGGSAGCFDLGGSIEQRDARTAVEWVAGQPWSDGKVGYYGESYDGIAGLMAMKGDPEPLKAAALASTPASFYRGNYTNRVSNASLYGNLPGGYTAFSLLPPPPSASTPELMEALINAAGSNDPRCFAAPIVEGHNDDPATPFWQEREIAAAMGTTKVPTLISQGYLDASGAVHPDHFPLIWDRLEGPRQAWLGQFGHGAPIADKSGRAGWDPTSEDPGAVIGWFDRFVKGKGGPPKSQPTVVMQQAASPGEWRGRWHGEAEWPPRDASMYDIPVAAGSYLDAPENLRQQDGLPMEPPGRATWTVTQTLPYDVHLIGEPEVTVDLDIAVPGVTIVASLWDVAPDGKAWLITESASEVRSDGPVRFPLWMQDWRVQEGHRIALNLSASGASGWFEPSRTSSIVTVEGGSFSLPSLRFDRDTFLEGGSGVFLDDPLVWGRTPIDIDDETIDHATIQAELPPPLVKRGSN